MLPLVETKPQPARTGCSRDRTARQLQHRARRLGLPWKGGVLGGERTRPRVLGSRERPRLSGLVATSPLSCCPPIQPGGHVGGRMDFGTSVHRIGGHVATESHMWGKVSSRSPGAHARPTWQASVGGSRKAVADRSQTGVEPQATPRAQVLQWGAKPRAPSRRRGKPEHVRQRTDRQPAQRPARSGVPVSRAWKRPLCGCWKVWGAGIHGARGGVQTPRENGHSSRGGKVTGDQQPRRGCSLSPFALGGTAWRTGRSSLHDRTTEEIHREKQRRAAAGRRQ